MDSVIKCEFIGMRGIREWLYSYCEVIRLRRSALPDSRATRGTDWFFDPRRVGGVAYRVMSPRGQIQI